MKKGETVMAKLTPQEATEKHARRLKGSTEDIRRGVSRVTEAPGIAAAAKQDKMRQRLMESLDSGKWANRVKSVSLQDWQRLMVEKGVGRIAAGIDEAKEKTEDFFAQLFQHQEGLQRKVENMPDLTIEDSINRMSTFIRGMAEFKRK
jgi:hypothetical protein